jgi:hypothetical protein
MLEAQPPFGLLHVLGMAIVGCLAFAAFTDEWLWTGIAILAAGVLSAWAYIVARREHGDDDPSRASR